MAAVKPTDPALFATSGSTSVPAPGRIADGWLGPAAPGLDGDIPPAEEFNWKWQLDGLWNEWVRQHGAARFATLDDAVAARDLGWLTPGTSFVLERVDSVALGERTNGTTTGGVNVTEVRADGELILATSNTTIRRIARDGSGISTVYTGSQALNRIAFAGRDIYVTDATGGALRRIHHIRRSDFGLVSVLAFPVGQDPIALATDGEKLYTAQANFDVTRRTLTLGSDAWSSPYNHGSAVYDLAADGRYVYVAGEDASGGGTNHVVALNRLTGAVVWTSGTGIPGGVNGRAHAIEVDGRFVYVASQDTASGHSMVSKLSRFTGEVVASVEIEFQQANDIAVDAENVFVTTNDAGELNVIGFDKVGLVPLFAFDYDGSNTVRPRSIATDSSRVYVVGEAGALDGEIQSISRGTVPSTWFLEDVTSAVRRYHNVFSPGER